MMEPEAAAQAASTEAAIPVQHNAPPGKSTAADTLVIYTYSKSDPEYERNLIFFIKHGMWENDGCQYLIIVQQVAPWLINQVPIILILPVY